MLGGPIVAFTGGELMFYVWDVPLPCWQAWTQVYVFCQTVPLIVSSRIIVLLDDPFALGRAASVDNYNVDALMGSTEQCIFASLRAHFDLAAMEPPAGGEDGAATALVEGAIAPAAPTSDAPAADSRTAQAAWLQKQEEGDKDKI